MSDNQEALGLEIEVADLARELFKLAWAQTPPAWYRDMDNPGRWHAERLMDECFAAAAVFVSVSRERRHRAMTVAGWR